jgi:hypothetical protein
MGRLENRVAIVTGAGIARRYAREGCKVVVAFGFSPGVDRGQGCLGGAGGDSGNYAQMGLLGFFRELFQAIQKNGTTFRRPPSPTAGLHSVLDAPDSVGEGAEDDCRLPGF